MPLEIIRHDITKVRADVIVNTANPRPVVGPGTDFAIYQAAGYEELLAEREKIGPMQPGEARCTPAFRLPAKYIIHTVGPVWKDGTAGEMEVLASCYRNALALADELQAESVAFPLISSGAYRFPKAEALKTAIAEISHFLFDHEMTVYLVVYDKEAFEVSGKAFAGIRSFIEESEVKTVAQARSEANRRRWEEALAQREREFASYGMPPSSKPSAEAAPGTAPDYSQAPMPQYAPAAPAAPAGVAPAKAPGAIPASEAEKKAPMPLESARKRRRLGPAVLLETLFEKLRPQEEEEKPEEAEELSQNYAGVAQPVAAPTAARKEDADVAPAEAGPTPIWGSEAKPREEEDEWLPQAAGPVVEEHKLEAHPLSFDFAEAVDLDELLRQKGDTFQEHLFRLIDRKGMDDVEVYKKANIDRKHFSKIKSNVNYHPKKTTAVAFAIALGLNLDETQDLLKCAGLALAPGNVFDLIVGYCITHKVRDINEINCILFDYEQPTLGA